MDGHCWLIDLSSDLRLEEVLDKIVENALQAMPRKDFALVVVDEDGAECSRSTGMGPGARRRLAAWSEDSGALERPQAIDDLGGDDGLARLTMRAHGQGFTALRSAPLRAHGHGLGALIALAGDQTSFDDDDAELLAAFAEQAGIALANALLFQELVEQATEDALTGLPNRREFESLLRRELERSGRYGEIFSLVMLDLDGFKAVNDSRGHDAGDALLRDVAATIRETCRTADVSARYGGDEFALILPETDQFEAAALCERLRVEVETLGAVSLTWGVAEYPTHGTSRGELMRGADAAMYAAKPQEPRAAA